MPAIGSSKKKKRKTSSGTTKKAVGFVPVSILIHLVYIVFVGIVAGGVVYYYEAIKPADYMGRIQNTTS